MARRIPRFVAGRAPRRATGLVRGRVLRSCTLRVNNILYMQRIHGEVSQTDGGLAGLAARRGGLIVGGGWHVMEREAGDNDGGLDICIWT
jgi:hypothetical protein